MQSSSLLKKSSIGASRVARSVIFFVLLTCDGSAFTALPCHRLWFTSSTTTDKRMRERNGRTMTRQQQEEDDWNVEDLKEEIIRRSTGQEPHKVKTSSSKDDSVRGNVSPSALAAKDATEEEPPRVLEETEDEPEFDGYAMRDVLLHKFGHCFDVDFRRVESMGQRNVYLNVMPFVLGSRKFRHETEYDYLCHLQAVVEILVKYDRLEYILMQIAETDKMPRAATSPLIAVPLRLDLPKGQVDDILGG